MERITRRRFLSKSGRSIVGAALGGTALSAAGTAHVLGANERVNIALIGCGGRGKLVTQGLIDCGAEVSYVCDLHEERLETAAQETANKQGRRPKKVKQMRRVFDAKDVDGVVIATPDHWHGPATILACQAGKDVYVEKPHSHNIWESRKMIQAVRKYKRIVQAGTQNRSAPYNFAARDYIRSGKLGDIRLVKVYNLKPGKPFYLGEAGIPPKGFNWDAWLGPAPVRPYHQRLFKGGWHRFWDFSGGDMANDGIHQLDLAVMLMCEPGMPKAVSCTAGRLQHKADDSEVPDTQVVCFDFDQFVMTFEQTGYPRYMQKTTGTIRRKDEFPYWTQNATRIELYGSEELMIVGRHGGGWIAMTSGGRVVEKMYGRPGDRPHEQNFLECIKSRKAPNADVEILHPSLALVHMGNIAHRVGNQTLRFDPKKEQFIDNAEANKLAKRKYRERYEVHEQV